MSVPIKFIGKTIRIYRDLDGVLKLRHHEVLWPIDMGWKIFTHTTSSQKDP